MVVFFGLATVGEAGWDIRGMEHAAGGESGEIQSHRRAGFQVPFSTIFTGVILLHLFYWCTNQQIIQRTLGAKSLAEGQKGVLLTGGLKLIGPLFLVIPGIIAFHLFSDEITDSDQAYGKLVSEVLPKPLVGFFAAVVLGAILSSFNSALNSTCTLFSLGLYKNSLKKDATQGEIVRTSRIFGVVMTLVAIIMAPLLASTGGIFDYLQKMNGIYAIPIFSVVVMGLLHRRVPAIAANVALVAGFSILVVINFVPGGRGALSGIPEFHQLGIVFALLILLMFVIATVKPREQPWVQVDAGILDLTPWKYAKVCGVLLVLAVTTSYLAFIL